MKSNVEPAPFIRRVRVKNYRSIADCDVTLGPLSVLLGFNASGKSNFLDVIRFVQDSLRESPESAVSARGGLASILRQSDQQASSFEIWLDLNFGTEPLNVSYGFEMGSGSGYKKRLTVVREECRIESSAYFLAEGGHLKTAPPGFPQPSGVQLGYPNTLQLPIIASALETFTPLRSMLTSMRFYELDSAVIRSLDEETTRQDYLGPAGEHIGHVLGNLAEHDPLGKERFDSYLSAIVPNALGVDERPEGRYSTIETRFRPDDTSDQMTVFPRESMSEGTLRAAGVLAALFQEPASKGGISLIGIEEPETALHPATVGALYEALTEASERVQVIVTSQSSDLLDNDEADLTHIRAVANVGGVTYVGEVDRAGHRLVSDKLMTIAELHRSGQMLPVQVGYPVEERP